MEQLGQLHERSSLISTEKNSELDFVKNLFVFLAFLKNDNKEWHALPYKKNINLYDQSLIEQIKRFVSDNNYDHNLLTKYINKFSKQNIISLQEKANQTYMKVNDFDYRKINISRRQLNNWMNQYIDDSPMLVKIQSLERQMLKMHCEVRELRMELTEFKKAKNDELDRKDLTIMNLKQKLLKYQESTRDT